MLSFLLSLTMDLWIIICCTWYSLMLKLSHIWPLEPFQSGSYMVLSHAYCSVSTSLLSMTIRQTGLSLYFSCHMLENWAFLQESLPALTKMKMLSITIAIGVSLVLDNFKFNMRSSILIFPIQIYISEVSG